LLDWKNTLPSREEKFPSISPPRKKKITSSPLKGEDRGEGEKKKGKTKNEEGRMKNEENNLLSLEGRGLR